MAARRDERIDDDAAQLRAKEQRAMGVVLDVPRTETTGRRGGIHNSLTRLLIKPTHLIGGYAQLSFAFNYLGPTGNQRDEVTVIRRRSQEVTY